MSADQHDVAGLLRPDPESPVPPYEQVRARVAALAADGTLPAGTRLPPVRALATGLGLAANTVARAYRELEADRVVVTEGRRGTFVRPGQRAAPAERAAEDAAAAYVAEVRRLGLTAAEATRLVERAWH
jgi:DNA-binding transcriptional regulator YhcF (GntR family)